MKIKDKHFFHGAALAKIVEHDSFKALNKADDEKYGHYQVNHNRRLLIKHSETGGPSWQFTFKDDDLKTLLSDIMSDMTMFVVLVCGTSTICVLRAQQVRRLIDLEAESQQWIRVRVPKSGASMHVTGSRGSLKRTIPHNAFPNRLFPS